jgi:ATP-dependent DNA helicase RecG
VLPYNVNPADYAKGEGASLPRNPAIANVLFRCNKIEAFGSGFYRVISLCKNAGVKYQYNTEFEGFKIEFIRTVISPSVKGENVPIKLSDTELAVYQLVKDNGDLTAEQISAMLGKALKTIQRAFGALKQKGFVKRGGSSKNGRWLILK